MRDIYAPVTNLDRDTFLFCFSDSKYVRTNNRLNLLKVSLCIWKQQAQFIRLLVQSIKHQYLHAFQENFTAARYHLAASLVMMDRYKEDDLVVQDLEEEKGSKTEMEKEVKEKDEEDKNLEEENENKESRRYLKGFNSIDKKSDY